jgi:HSP20 family protein
MGTLIMGRVFTRFPPVELEVKMAIVRWGTPAADRLDQIEQRMQQLFDQPFRFPFLAEEMGWSPSVEVEETDGAVEVTVELPGVGRDDIEMGLENNVLTIRGEKKKERREGEKESYILERYYGSFQRSFSLPVLVDEDRVQAEFNDGVLRVHLEKAPEAKGRRIEIKG